MAEKLTQADIERVKKGLRLTTPRIEHAFSAAKRAEEDARLAENRAQEERILSALGVSEEPVPQLIAKGSLGGECYRTVCHTSGARYFNESTQMYYCEQCAIAINEGHRVTSRPGEWMHGKPLCTLLVDEPT